MLTHLFNHLISIYESTSARDNRAGLLKDIGAVRYDSVPGRVEVYAPRRISRQQQFDFGSRQLYIDHVIYTESPAENGDFVKWLSSGGGADQYFRLDAIVTFLAQGSLPTYYVIGALEIKI